MQVTIPTEFLEAAHATSLGDLESVLVRFAQKRDFEIVSAVMVIDGEAFGDGAQFLSVGNIPEAFYSAHKNVDNSRRDPVLQAVKRQTTPVMWDRGTYQRAGADDLWEEQAPFGFKQGVGLAMHPFPGRHYLLGMNGPDPVAADAQARGRLLDELQLMALCSQNAAMRLMKAPEPVAPEVYLTPRERDVLSWTARDKSAWVVGQLLGVSEHTVAFHLKNAMRKLGCATKHSAATKALKLGLISVPSR